MRNGANDASFVSEALPSFISEAREQADAIERLLLELEQEPQDRERLNALFRCAHTVKGSAGIFGLDEIVRFTHEVETLLDALRAGKVVFTTDLGSLLLLANDEIRLLVSAASDSAADLPERHDARALLVGRMRSAGGLNTAENAAADATSAPAGQPQPSWHVSAQFGQDCFRNGLDPLAVLSYVSGLGSIPKRICDVAAIPRLEDIDPESCHLAIQFRLDTTVPRQEIESAFSFVREDCVLHVIAPGATTEQIVALIDAMPDKPRLGEILVAVGAVSRQQLGQALAQQAESAARNEPRPLGEILRSQSGLSPEVISAALQKQEKLRPPVQTMATADDQRLIRVQADRLDAVINLIGELVIAGAGASLLAHQTRQRGLIEANAQISRLVEELRNDALKLRMVPIGDTFARFRRVVRDTAADLGKDVALEIVGADTELDKSVVERIADPLMHLVRNALDHGLETPAAREAAGKARQGKLTLEACHDSGAILIRIIDDGRGIQREKVLARAWETGLIEHGTRPSDDEILDLIFRPGFSTAEQVSNLSGRGVGMDVVRRNIEALRGSVALRSVEGAGCAVEIRLPLTLAIIDGFLVGVDATKFIFPLEAVVEVIEPRFKISTVDEAGTSCIELRGHVLPVVDLRALYGLEPRASERVSVVVLRAGGRPFGVAVDALHGQHQIVIKPLGRLFRNLQGISGSAILGSGEVALIFDVPALAAFATAMRPTLPARNDRTIHATLPS